MTRTRSGQRLINLGHGRISCDRRRMDSERNTRRDSMCGIAVEVVVGAALPAPGDVAARCDQAIATTAVTIHTLLRNARGGASARQRFRRDRRWRTLDLSQHGAQVHAMD
jgi:hypothetical protein